ncbi:hybrid sensor histidine kinase/response regulator, partial [Serratia marcescens]|nr:hybrid sensor histidine kinase/response regulator [Serratia marcescens]
IPLYHHQNTVLSANDRWQGKVLWLDIRNARLESYLLDLLGYFSATIRRYCGEQTQPEDVLICDYPSQLSPPLLAWIQLSIEHIGLPQET